MNAWPAPDPATRGEPYYAVARGAILTVGRLREVLEHLDDDMQVVADDGESWYVNIPMIGVPFRDDDELDCSPFSVLTLVAGEAFDTRQI